MLFILILSYLLLSVSYKKFDLTSIRKALKHNEKIYKDSHYDYTVPSWAYKNAFNHNKKYNSITKKLQIKDQTYQEQKRICLFYKIPLKYLE